LHDFDGGFSGDDAATEGQNVGVIVFAGEPRGRYIVSKGGANTKHFVGGDGNAYAGAAHGDPEIGLF